MSLRSKVLATAAALALAGGVGTAGLVAVTQPASATTLTCTNTQSATVAPYGCGGLQIQPGYTRGQLSLSVGTNSSGTPLEADSAPVIVEPTGINLPEQDFTVFALDDSVTDGPGDLGAYIAASTPDAQLAYITVPSGQPVPGDCTTVTTASTVYKDVIPCSGEDFYMGPGDYCISVADYKGPNGKTRWWALERECDSTGEEFTYGTEDSAGYVSASFANRWQVWAPVTGSSGLKMVNVSLYNKDDSDYDLNITADGGAGTQVQAYPDNTAGYANDQWIIEGCTPPITLLNTSYWAC